jgi:hypothetical protein
MSPALPSRSHMGHLTNGGCATHNPQIPGNNREEGLDEHRSIDMIGS